uniref:Transcription cofactor vestigial-like protein 1 n=1 Tax=Cyclopterus lumpus TaxID=8103 RepID=A0A8C3AVQ1_CYCLU
MENRNDSPMAVKVEEHSRGVILTYFQGDINSMVDAHFTRALGKVCKAKAPAVKTKKFRKNIKLALSQNCIPAGLCLKDLETLWTPLQALNQVGLLLPLTSLKLSSNNLMILIFVNVHTDYLLND